MKICWDNLENIKLTKKGVFYDKVKKKSYIYKEECKTCKKSFLYRTDCIGDFCSVKCAKTGKKKSEKTKAKISKSLSGRNHPMYCKHLSEETRRKISNSEKGKKCNKGEKTYTWKGSYYLNNIPTYNTYAHQIEWCESVRRNKNDRNILEVKCAYCGKWFVPKRVNIQNRIQILKSNRKYDGDHKLYCSNSCKQECPIYKQHKYPRGFKPATSREVQPELRQMVFERDDWTCQKCDSTKNLHCHHIEGILWEPLESADMDKCITLCKSCHKEVHKLPDCRYNDLKCAA